MSSLLTTSGIPAAVNIGTATIEDIIADHITIDSIAAVSIACETATTTVHLHNIGTTDLDGAVTLGTDLTSAHDISAVNLTASNNIVTTGGSIQTDTGNIEAPLGTISGASLVSGGVISASASILTSANIIADGSVTGASIAGTGTVSGGDFFTTGVASSGSVESGRVTASIGFASPAATDLNLQTNGTTTRMTIPSAGISAGAIPASVFVVLDGTTLKSVTASDIALYLQTQALASVNWGTSFTGGTTPSTNIYFSELFNGVVMMHVDMFHGTMTGNTAITAIAAVPLAMRPAADTVFFNSIINNGVIGIGETVVRASSGDIEFYSSVVAGTFTIATDGGTNAAVYMSWATF